MKAFKIAGLAGLLALALPFAGAQAQTKVTLGVGGKPVLYYLPLTIAERKGFFKEEGLDVQIQDFAGGARALQALVGGSVDVVTGAYEHTIRMQAKGQDVRAVTELGRFPGITVGVKKELAGEIKSPADFKGRKIGVTAPGSSTALVAQYAMVKAGLKPSDAAIIGVGATASAVAAMQRGEIEIISNAEPVISKMEQDGLIVSLVDTRTEEGTRKIFGGSNPAATLYSTGAYIEKNPETMQRLTNAFLKSLKWLRTAKPEEVADAVPAEYHLGDKDLYTRAVKNSLESYSRDGVVAQAGMTSVMDMLRTLDPEMQAAQVDLSKTFTDRFVKASPVKMQ
ncbi:MAG TPA: ABC transporter substrate-binding protein [Microvirga sp.]|jgi:NitT/TauT family transport system substrate-binding protein|nr:ABC transporter substrate-binding protein [Microvirga sp.]